MKKRLGSKIYDTDTAELVCPIDGGQLYRKRTRDREWFAVFEDGTIRPLDVYNPADVLLMETGHLPDDAFDDPDPTGKNVRLDPETWSILTAASKAEGIPVTGLVRRAVQKEFSH